MSCQLSQSWPKSCSTDSGAKTMVSGTRTTNFRVVSQPTLQLPSASWKRFPTNRKISTKMFSRSSLIDCGDDLHSNNLLLSPSTLLFWRSSHSEVTLSCFFAASREAWWKLAGSASLNFFRIPLISAQKRPEPKDDSNFNHFQIQSRRGDHELPARGSRLLQTFVRACWNFSPR